MAHEVFISYSSIDKAAAEAACAAFEANGIRCWIAPRNILPGREWAGAIYAAITEAKVMVLIFSANANSSAQVRREVELAVNEGLTIMPIRLEDHKPTESMAYFMAGVHWIDAVTPPLEAHLETVVAHIKPYLPPQPAHSVAPIGVAESYKLMDEALHFAQIGADEDAIDALLPVLERIEAMASDELNESHALVLYNLGCRYFMLRRWEQAGERFSEVVRRFGDSAVPMLREVVCQSMVYLGTVLAKLSRYDEALDNYADMLRRYENDTSTEIAENVLMALSNQAIVFQRQYRKLDELVAYDSVISRAGPNPSSRATQLVADAMRNKGILLANNGRPDEGLATLRDSLARFETSTEVGLLQIVAQTLVAMASILIFLKRFDEALAACDRVIDPPGDSRFQDVHIAAAMDMRADGLRKAGRPAEAIAALDAMILRFAGAVEEDIRSKLSMAQILKRQLTAAGRASR